MKRRILSIIAVAMMVLTMIPSIAFAEEAAGTPEGIPITEEYFPDDTLRNKLIEMDNSYEYEFGYRVYDDYRYFSVQGNSDGYLSDNEIANIKGLEFEEVEITSLEGVQYLTSLVSVSCDKGSFVSVPELPETIEYLKLINGKLESIDVSKLANLVILYCYNNNLKGTLDVSGCPDLNILDASNNELTSVVLNSNCNFDYGSLDLRYNSMTRISDIKNLNSDYYEGSDYNFWPQGEEVDVEINATNFPDKILRDVLTEIEKTDGQYNGHGAFYIYGNGNGILESNELRSIPALSFSDNETITSLKGLEYLTSLEYFHVESGSFTSISYLPVSLKSLSLKNCGLTSIDVSGLPNLEELDVRYNKMTDKSQVTGFTGNSEDLLFNSQDIYGNVAIDEINFPDEVLRAEISSYDDNNNGILSINEMEDITSLYIYEQKIESLKGIELLPCLTYIDCDENYIEELVALPPALEYFSCSDNLIKELPALPESLVELSCSGNVIEKLPTLPAGLELLNCSENKLTELPELPQGLESLSCSYNQIAALPELPDSLTYLDCDKNKLTDLPELVNTKLEKIYCSENELTKLPALPQTLEYLSCSYNKLAELPELPDSITTLNCSYNEFTSLPKLPKYLETLYAEENKLGGVLDISQNMYLEDVDVSENILTGLVVSDKAKYGLVDVDDNFMSGKEAVTGRSDIDWEGVFHFGWQKEYCDVYGHDYVQKIRKATISQNYLSSGSISYICTKCQEEDWDRYEVIRYHDKVKFTPASHTYNGKVKKPTVVLYDSTGKIIDKSNYTVAYAKGFKNVGRYKVTIKYRGKYYTGSRYEYFYVNPKGTSVSSLTKAKKAFTVKWKKQAAKMSTSRITGYQIRYSTKSTMGSAKIKTVAGYSKTSAKITKLNAKKKYYVQVRTYKTINGIKYYSPWSAKKTVTTK